MKVLITGATGLIGHETAGQLLKASHEVFGVSRNAGVVDGPIKRWIEWDLTKTQAPAETFENITAVVHLAGEPIAEGRWTNARKQRIRESRVAGTRNLVDSMRLLRVRPKVLISGSAVGIYGDRGEEFLDESSSSGTDFLANVVQEWEAEALKAKELGVRVVLLRTGVVLGKNNGALSKMLLPFKFGVGGRLGTGLQWFPWIHLKDEAGLIVWALDHSEVSGALNAVAPETVTNQDFAQKLGRALHRPAIFAMPAFAIKVVFGEMAGVLLASQKVVPGKALKFGYKFRFPDLGSALSECLTQHGVEQV